MKELENAKNYGESAIEQGESRIKHAVSEIENKLKHGQEQAEQLFSTVDKQLHQNPWPIVVGVAASCLLLGVILGKSKR